MGTVLGDGKADDQDFLISSIMLKDPAAIKAVNDGSDQLSIGYRSTFAIEGPNNIALAAPPLYNHCALVDKGAAGPEAKVLASKETGMDEETKQAEITKLWLVLPVWTST